jgi:hypothetical protein
MVAATFPGAQTERRGGAGPVRGLLGGKGPSGRFVAQSRIRHFSKSPSSFCHFSESGGIGDIAGHCYFFFEILTSNVPNSLFEHRSPMPTAPAVQRGRIAVLPLRLMANLTKGIQKKHVSTS